MLKREHFRTTSNAERILEIYGPTPLIFWGPHGQPMHADLARAGREGWYLPYPPADGIATPPTEESPNQSVQFFNWREHLAGIAIELQHQQFERGAIRTHAIRGHASRPANLSTEDSVRNANMSQWGREQVGRLWRELHEWAQLDPESTTNDWNGVRRQELQAKIEGFCAACEGRGRVDLIHDEHSHLLWQEALRLGKRFLPDFNQSPFGVLHLAGDGTMNGATAVTDIGNFRNAVRFYSISHSDRIVDVWPGDLDSDVTEQPVPPPVTVPPGNHEAERERVARFYAEQFFVMSRDPYLDQAYVRTYQSHCEMNLLAVLRPENWDNQGIIDQMIEAQVTGSDYLLMNSNPIHEYWTGRDAPVWRNGYIRFYRNANVYVRDARPLDPVNDPTTIPEGADSSGDFRVSTHVQVILESEIDRSNTTIRGGEQPWTAEAEWLDRVGEILAPA